MTDAPIELSDRIVSDPDISAGRPCIKGTRVRVSDIVAAMAAGESVADILDDFPYLEADDIFAAVESGDMIIELR